MSIKDAPIIPKEEEYDVAMVEMFDTNSLDMMDTPIISWIDFSSRKRLQVLQGQWLIFSSNLFLHPETNVDYKTTSKKN